MLSKKGEKMSKYEGRCISDQELTPVELKKLTSTPSVFALSQKKEKNLMKCFRCGSSIDSTFFCYPNGQKYCPYCLTLGVVTQDSHFFLPPLSLSSTAKAIKEVCYPHPLTPLQQKASDWLVEQYKKRKTKVLLWAVTGAGKTEMSFRLIQTVLKKGKKVGFAAPRIDVCLEIAPRLKKAFPEINHVLLYGKSEETFNGEDLVVCTTHQLLRFHRYFELIIIDEADAFPFFNNPILSYGVKRALANEGMRLFVTATPSKVQIRQYQTHTLPAFLLPARFHRKALSLPKMIWFFSWQKRLLKKIPMDIQKKLLKDQWLIFCPEIHWMKKWFLVLKNTFPEKRICYLYANDPLRFEKVKRIRQQAYDLILTTTILERGVTLPNIHVFVVGSNHRIFKKEVLIQICGRVGRSIAYPTGQIFFIHDGKTKAMKACVKEIQFLNQKAKKEGLIDEML